MKILSGVMNSVSDMYHAYLRGLKKLPEHVAGQELTTFSNILLRNLPHNVSSQRELESTSHEIFEGNEMGDSCDLAKRSIKPGGQDHMSCFVFSFFRGYEDFSR